MTCGSRREGGNGKLQLVDPTIWLNCVRVGGSVVIIDYVQLIVFARLQIPNKFFFVKKGITAVAENPVLI